MWQRAEAPKQIIVDVFLILSKFSCVSMQLGFLSCYLVQRLFEQIQGTRERETIVLKHRIWSHESCCVLNSDLTFCA